MKASEWCRMLHKMMHNAHMEYKYFNEMAGYAPNMEVEEWCKLMSRCRHRDYNSMKRVYDMYCMKSGTE